MRRRYQDAECVEEGWGLGIKVQKLGHWEKTGGRPTGPGLEPRLCYHVKFGSSASKGFIYLFIHGNSKNWVAFGPHPLAVGT